MTPDAVKWNASEAVRSALYPEEVVLWTGRPVATRGLDRQDVRFIIFSAYFALVYWGVAFFGLTSSSLLFVKVVPPFVQIAYFVAVRPAIRRAQRRSTVFAVTRSRALVIQGPPSPGLEVANLPAPFQSWRREDGRGSVAFDVSPSRETQGVSTGMRIGLQVILFLVGLASWPFGGRRRKGLQLVFFEVDDVDQLVQILQGLGPSDQFSNLDSPLAYSDNWDQSVERRFTPSRRTVCAVLGVILVVVTIPVIAVRLRDYLQHSPSMPRPGTIELTLRPATYVVFENTAYKGPYDCYSVTECATINPSDVNVVSTSGDRLAVVEDPGVGIITDGEQHLLGVVKFDVNHIGTYIVTIRSSTKAEFVIAIPPSEEAKALAGWIAGGVLGIILILFALVSGLIARGRRRSYN
jgi:hypothetical protein